MEARLYRRFCMTKIHITVLKPHHAFSHKIVVRKAKRSRQSDNQKTTSSSFDNKNSSLTHTGGDTVENGKTRDSSTKPMLLHRAKKDTGQKNQTRRADDRSFTGLKLSRARIKKLIQKAVGNSSIIELFSPPPEGWNEKKMTARWQPNIQKY